MSFEKHYKEILIYAKKRIAQYSILTFEAEDVISNVYLSFIDNGIPYEFGAFQKAIADTCIKEHHTHQEHIFFGIKGTSTGNFIGDKVCTKCKEVLPSSEFKIVGVGKNSTKKYQLTVCISCEKIKRSLRKPKDAEKTKEQNKLRQEKYRNKNKKKSLAVLKEANKIARAEIKDWYVKLILKDKYSVEYINSHPELIEECRQRVIEKRALAKQKRQIQNSILTS